MDDRRSPPPQAAHQASLSQVRPSPPSPHRITQHVVKGHVKEAQGPRDLPVRTAGDTVTPIGVPMSPRGKAPAYWSPCLAVASDHVKHTRDPQDPPNLAAADSGTAIAAPQLLPRIRCTAADPTYPVHPTPDAAGTPNATAQGRTLPAVPLGPRSIDTAIPQGSLVSREGTPFEGIPPTDGGTPHPNQARSLSGPGGTDRATNSSDRPAFVVTLQAGSYNPPCALPRTCVLHRMRCYLALICKQFFKLFYTRIIQYCGQVGVPMSPRGKAPAYWSPCLAVASDHVKHTRDPQDPPNLAAADSGTAIAAPQLLPRIRCTAADPTYPVHPTPDAAGTPNATAQGRTLPAVPLGPRSIDTAIPQGSLVSREGTPFEGIPPTDGGTPHPNQARSLSGPGGTDRATNSSDRPAFVVTLQAGSYNPPCALPRTCVLPGMRCYLALICKQFF